MKSLEQFFPLERENFVEGIKARRELLKSHIKGVEAKRLAEEDLSKDEIKQ